MKSLKMSDTALFLLVLFVAMMAGNLIAYKMCFDRLHYSYVGTTTISISDAHKLNQQTIQDIVNISDNTTMQNGFITTYYNFSSTNYYPELNAICTENHYAPFYLYSDEYNENWVARFFGGIALIILILFITLFTRDNLKK